MSTETERATRYLLSIMPATLDHLRTVARETRRSTGQVTSVATLIRQAIHQAYPLVESPTTESLTTKEH